ncbi:hypothetical protein FDG2_6126 [Candidatus Protofrankia californiensis]|uniref:Uncharacterized protein n=1 Tax=Candidatus Protofrankia californiensis TaxID=1839754 RepID=A0A1C3PGB4_9ACTN|nr:hypothetical protein FDG2_6126 [Candidatus Protofrankia californiensis]
MTSDDIKIIHDTSGTLDRWLTRHRASAALLRPDRTVFTTARAVDLTLWHRELESAGMRDVPQLLRPADSRQPQQPLVNGADHARSSYLHVG